MEEIEISCTVCYADYKVYHNLGEPYIPKFCAFCGEEFEDVVDWLDDDYIEDD